MRTRSVNKNLTILVLHIVLVEIKLDYRIRSWSGSESKPTCPFRFRLRGCDDEDEPVADEDDGIAELREAGGCNGKFGVLLLVGRAG